MVENNLGENDISIFPEILDPKFEEILAEEMAKIDAGEPILGKQEARHILNNPENTLGQIDPNQQNSNLYMQDKEVDYMNDHPEEKTEELESVDEDIMYDPKTKTYIIGTNIDYDPENYDWIRQARERQSD